MRRVSPLLLGPTLALLLSAFMISGCRSAREDAVQEATVASASDREFQKVAEEFLAGYLQWRPAQGVALGLHEYDGRTTDYSRASLDAELARLKSFERRLAAMETASMSPRTFYDFRILRAAIAREVFRFEEREVFTRNPMTYAGALNVLIYVKRDFAPFEQRVKSLTTILEGAPKIFSAARANLAEALPRPFIETAIEQAQGSVDFLSKDLLEALKPLKNAALRERFTAANATAIEELRGYVKWLKEQRLPKASENYALGREKFARMLRDGELVLESPEKILEVGLRDLAREQKIFADTARLIDPARPPIEVFKAIQRDHPTAENLIPDTRKNLEAIRQFVVDRRVITIPSKVRVRVEETPPFDRATSFASMDTPGPFEKKATEAYYYITPVEKDWPARQQEEWLTAFNYYTTDVVSIHEAYPGHYVQFLCLNASPANRLEKILDSYSFIEGWAHYTEQMLLDEGFPAAAGKTPTAEESLRTAKYRLAQSVEALLRQCRLCVAIKMHCQGMNVDEATKFFQANCYYEEKPARQEAIRGTFDPEYLYYTLGKLQILKLREDWRKEKGAAFTLQKFHDEFLRHGMPPIRLLREVMLRDSSIWDESFPTPAGIGARGAR